MRSKGGAFVLSVVILWAMFTLMFISLGGDAREAVVFTAYKIPTFAISIGMYALLCKLFTRGKVNDS